MDNSKIKSGQVSLTEHLSALLDDEAGSFEQRRVLDELKADDKLCDKLSKFALIGESMRSGNAQVPVTSNFLSGIHDQISAEPEYDHIHLGSTNNNTKRNKSQSLWLRPLGGFAMAASVAAIAVLGVQNYQSTSPVQGFDSVTSAKTAAPVREQLSVAEMVSARPVAVEEVDAVNDAVPSSNEYAHADARTRSFLKRYVDSHMQHTSPTTFVPSVRVIAYADN